MSNISRTKVRHVIPFFYIMSPFYDIPVSKNHDISHCACAKPVARFKFDDETVTPCSEYAAIEDNYGGARYAGYGRPGTGQGRAPKEYWMGERPQTDMGSHKPVRRVVHDCLTWYYPFVKVSKNTIESCALFITIP